MFFDSNVVIDVLARDPVWLDWSSAWIEQAQAQGGGFIDGIVLAELSPGYPVLAELLGVLDRLCLQILDFDMEAAYLAGRTFSQWRRSRGAGAERRVLPDFLIGAHASKLAIPLVTRDPHVYRGHFPDLTLITPETKSDG